MGYFFYLGVWFFYGVLWKVIFEGGISLKFCIILVREVGNRCKEKEGI